MQAAGLDSISEFERFILAQNGGLASPAQQSMIISCPKKMVGRVIGKNGETIKALQQFTGAQIQIDQRSDPTRVSIAGAPKAMQMATSMVQDIVAGTFKGFAMLRSYATQATKAPGALEFLGQPAPVYIEGYGFIPPSQFSDAGEGPYGYSQLQGFGAEQVPSQASLSALTQLYSLQNQQDINMVMPTVQAYGMPNVTPQFNDLDPASRQQAHMASLARSLFEAPDMKRANGMLMSGSMSASQQELPSGAGVYASAGLVSSAGLGPGPWSQAPALTLEAAPPRHSPKHSSEHSPSRDHSPTTAEGARPTTLGPQDPNNLAAQLQALSLLSNFQEGKREVLQSENSQHGPKWNVAGQGNGSSSPTKPQPLPHGWMQITDPEKRVLYHNYLTGHTQYTLPTVGQPGVEAPSGSSTDMDKTAAFPGLGQRMSGPASVGHSLHGDSTAAMLSQRMSGPASIGQRLPGSDSRAMATEAQPTGLDAASSGLTQRMQEQEFKIGAVL